MKNARCFRDFYVSHGNDDGMENDMKKSNSAHTVMHYSEKLVQICGIMGSTRRVIRTIINRMG